MLADRRNLFKTAVTATAVSTLAAAAFPIGPTPAFAALDLKKVVVAGSTGQTGRRILERLAGIKGLSVIAGVRNVDKAKAALGESSTVIRGAMVQQVASIDTSSVDLKHLDVVTDSVDELAATLMGAEALVIATGFIPGNPLKMNAEAHLVDNVGACALIDAAKKAGVKKVVMVSSILTNGRNWGQEKSPGFVITNAFGQVLDEKIVAENHLRASGLDYVRHVTSLALLPCSPHCLVSVLGLSHILLLMILLSFDRPL
jgi:nucleoside-diphosphate-sugar epimerase